MIRALAIHIINVEHDPSSGTWEGRVLGVRLHPYFFWLGVLACINAPPDFLIKTIFFQMWNLLWETKGPQKTELWKFFLENPLSLPSPWIENLKTICPGEEGPQKTELRNFFIENPLSLPPLNWKFENVLSRRRGSAKDWVAKIFSVKITCPGETPLIFYFSWSSQFILNNSHTVY